MVAGEAAGQALKYWQSRFLCPKTNIQFAKCGVVFNNWFEANTKSMLETVAKSSLSVSPWQRTGTTISLFSGFYKDIPGSPWWKMKGHINLGQFVTGSIYVQQFQISCQITVRHGSGPWLVKWADTASQDLAWLLPHTWTLRLSRTLSHQAILLTELIKQHSPLGCLHDEGCTLWPTAVLAHTQYDVANDDELCVAVCAGGPGAMTIPPAAACVGAIGARPGACVPRLWVCVCRGRRVGQTAHWATHHL